MSVSCHACQQCKACCCCCFTKSTQRCWVTRYLHYPPKQSPKSLSSPKFLRAQCDAPQRQRGRLAWCGHGKGGAGCYRASVCVCRLHGRLSFRAYGGVAGKMTVIRFVRSLQVNAQEVVVGTLEHMPCHATALVPNQYQVKPVNNQ